MRNSTDIQQWLVAQVAQLMGIAPESIDIREPFSSYGVSSLDAVTLSGDLEAWLGRRLPPTVVYDYPDIWSLSLFLAGESEPDPLERSHRQNPDEPIAIIGMACRFPGAPHLSAFWELLKRGGDAVSEVPADRWPKEAFYNPDPAAPGKSVSYWGGFLDRVDQFDPFFFGISPVEAKSMDPQQRLLLDLSYDALDDAGQMTEMLDGSRTGVFVGICVNEYSAFQFSDPAIITGHSATGSALSIAANRISYHYNFHGPSMAIDTACSSSLTAVYLACRSLRDGECDMALAGGANVILSPAHSIAFTKAGVLSPEGRCKTFDAGANGYVRGEGGGLVVLKRLSSALADGDPIQALILGGAMRQDGRTNGLIAPNRESQEKLLWEAYQSVGLPPHSVQYVEAHGTGTLLGDSMEAQALGAVVGAPRSEGACIIGSVKTNIGHLEAAAGVAGLIKVALSLRNRAIPPSLHFQTPSPYIPFDQLHLQVQQQFSHWPSVEGPATAGVSSFGFGGTNVHLVVQEAPESEWVKKGDDDSEDRMLLLPLSSGSPEMLPLLAADMYDLLNAGASVPVSDICSAAAYRRSKLHCRIACMGRNREELKSGLAAFLQGQSDPYLLRGGDDPGHLPKVAFVFSGQGGQWPGMARALLQEEPVFYDSIQKTDQVIHERYGWSLLDVLGEEHSTDRLQEIDVVQPALFAIQTALCALWKSWGIVPDAVVGHSMGEVAAAHVAGALSLEDAVRIICGRSRLMRKLRGRGSMLVTELSPPEAEIRLKGFEDKVSVAVVNSPSSTVLSGDTEAIQTIMGALNREQLFCKWVNVDVASHSPQMDEIKEELHELLADLNPRPPVIPVYSTVAEAQSGSLLFDAGYWMDNLRKPVLFTNAVGQLFDSGHTLFIEIGPHPVLLGAIQQSLPDTQNKVRLLPSLRREEPEREVLVKTLGTLYTEGLSVDWKSFYPHKTGYLPLPPVRRQLQRYWIDLPAGIATTPGLWVQTARHPLHPLLGERIDLAHPPGAFVWQAWLEAGKLPYLKDHRIDGEVILPAAAYMEMALQMLENADLSSSHELINFTFDDKMILSEDRPVQVQSLLSRSEDAQYLLQIFSRSAPGEKWVQHASGQAVQRQADHEEAGRMRFSTEGLRLQSESEIEPQDFYSQLHARGLQFGPAFRGIQYIWSKGSEALGRMATPSALQGETGDYLIHPALLDACLQVVAATQDKASEHSLYLPTGCRKLSLFSTGRSIAWSLVRLSSGQLPHADTIEADILLLDENEHIVAELAGFRVQRTNLRRRPAQQDIWMYRIGWKALEMKTAPPHTTNRPRQWLILADDAGLGRELAQNLESTGDLCRLVSTRNALRALSHTPDTALPKLMEEILSEFTAPLYGVIHLWSLSIPPGGTAYADPQGAMQTLGCNSVLYLLQALARRMAALPRLWMVTKGAQPVLPDDSIAIEQAPLWGMGKVIGFEMPDLPCVCVDLAAGQSTEEAASMLVQLLSSDDREDQVAFRGGTRWVPRLTSYTLPMGADVQEMALLPDYTYLITGGLGGLGLATAHWMVRRGARHIALLGRSAASEAAMSLVERMRGEGAEVVVMQADVSRRDRMAEVFSELERTMPPLRGIFHAAGVLDDGALAHLDAGRMDHVMAPKVGGAWNLHELSLHLPLDFFVLFSSAVSVLGSPGQANYAAANAYLDALAHHRRHRGLPALSINWGPWAEVGLAAEATERLREQNASTRHLIKVIQVDRGIEVQEQLLAVNAPQVTVLPFDLENLVELYPAAAGMPFLSEVGGRETHVARLYTRPNLRRQYVAPRNELERRLADMWRQTLHIDRVGVHDSFFELGGDSVLAAQILSLAQKSFGIRIHPQDAFKAFTIERLAEMLEAEIMRRIEEMTEEEAQRELDNQDVV